MSSLSSTFPSDNPHIAGSSGVPPATTSPRAASRAAKPPKPLPLTPYTVAVDDREKHFYPLASPLAELETCCECGRPHDVAGDAGDADDDAQAVATDAAPDAYDFSRPLKRDRRHYTIQTTRAHLTTGDYSIVGHESRVTVERKSLGDLFTTLGKAGRRRFVAELARLAAFEFAAVVIEAEWSTILLSPPERSRLDPKTIFHSVAAWTVRYPRLHWVTVPGREFGEVATARLLDWWYRTYATTVVDAVNK